MNLDLGQSAQQQPMGQQPMYQPVPPKRNPHKWICSIKHQWSNWETYEATWSASPLMRWLGHTKDSKSLIQIRQCARCGVTQRRDV